MGELENERELVADARRGDADAFITLCEAHRTRVWRVVASVAYGDDRDELAQETIVRAFSGLKSYRGDAPFAAWICRIALNAAHDYQKSAWRRRVVSLSYAECMSAEGGPGQAAEERELQRRIRQSVAALPSAQRIPIWLRYFEEFSIVEIARLERSTESTIRSRIQAGLKRLEASLGDMELDGLAHDKPVKGCAI